MEPDRFDDVEFRVLESPEPPPRPPRRRRHGRWAIAAAVSVVTAGALAAAASALTDKAEAPTKQPGLTRSQGNGGWSKFGRHECHRGKFGHRSDQGFDDSARY
jgi:hypothetical protein